MNKTQEDLVNIITKDTRIKKKIANLAVHGFIKAIQDILQQGDTLTLIGLGHFHVCTSPARKIINIQTKEKMTIPTKKYPKLVFGQYFKEIIENANPPETAEKKAGFKPKTGSD